MGSARDSRAGDGDLAIANFSSQTTCSAARTKFVPASRRNQYAVACTPQKICGASRLSNTVSKTKPPLMRVTLSGLLIPLDV